MVHIAKGLLGDTKCDMVHAQHLNLIETRWRVIRSWQSEMMFTYIHTYIKIHKNICIFIKYVYIILDNTGINEHIFVQA